MKKLLLCITALLVLTGCGNQNTLGWGNYTYNYITCNSEYLNIVNEPVETWKDFDGEQIEVTIQGNNLLVSSNSCFLSKDKVEY